MRSFQINCLPSKSWRWFFWGLLTPRELLDIMLSNVWWSPISCHWNCDVMKSHIKINEVVMNSRNVLQYYKTPFALPKVKLGFMKPIPTNVKKIPRGLFHLWIHLVLFIFGTFTFGSYLTHESLEKLTIVFGRHLIFMNIPLRKEDSSYICYIL